MSSRLKLALGIYVGVLNFTLTWAMVTMWPSAEPPPSGLPLEGRYILCAAAAGALGSYIHLATSFIEHAGRNRLVSTWAWWYFLRPWIGSALALVVYFVVRAGLVAGASGSGSVNPYGVAAMASLSGMFSQQATQKLREVFENLCGTDRAIRE